MRHSTSSLYRWVTLASSIAATTAVTPGAADLTAAIRSAEKVAMPQRRGRLDETTANRVGGIPQPPPGWWHASETATSDRARGRPRRAAMQLLYSTPTPESPSAKLRFEAGW